MSFNEDREFSPRAYSPHFLTQPTPQDDGNDTEDDEYESSNSNGDNNNRKKEDHQVDTLVVSSMSASSYHHHGLSKKRPKLMHDGNDEQKMADYDDNDDRLSPSSSTSSIENRNSSAGATNANDSIEVTTKASAGTGISMSTNRSGSSSPQVFPHKKNFASTTANPCTPPRASLRRKAAPSGAVAAPASPQQRHKQLQRTQRTALQYKEYRTNDEIHSDIKFNEVMKLCIDTPYFQRLRGLKQLGTSEYTYMNADHNRFQHSLGVSHLAKQLAERLQSQQPNLHISDKDVLCVTLAGLLHDIGHGPFSHVYDSQFPKQLSAYLERYPNLQSEYYGNQNIPSRPSNWEHEDGSCMMIHAILAYYGLQIDYNRLDEPLQPIAVDESDEKKCSSPFIEPRSLRVHRVLVDHLQGSKHDGIDEDILTSRDWIFIIEAIQGSPIYDNSNNQTVPSHDPSNGSRKNRSKKDLMMTMNHLRNCVHPMESGFIGRPQREKEFLYDIVNNRHNGLDVDKMDYFARDERRTEKGNGEVDRRLVEEALVAWGSCPKPNKCFRCRHSFSPSFTSTNNNKFVDTNRHLMIVWPVKCAKDTAAFFHRRFRNHSRIYQHKTTQATTYMISDILTYADPYYRIQVVDDLNNKKSPYPYGLPISRAMIDSDYYVRLRDSIIDKIEDTSTPELRPARLLIRRLRCRDFYKCVATMTEGDADDLHGSMLVSQGTTLFQQIFQKKESDIVQEMLNLRGYHDDSNGFLTEDDFIVEKAALHLGSKEENPLKQLRFLPKDLEYKKLYPPQNLPMARQVNVREYAAHIPMKCMERSIRIYCRTPEKINLVKHAFETWKTQYEDGVSRGMIEYTADEGDSIGGHNDEDRRSRMIIELSQPEEVSQEPWETASQQADRGASIAPLDESPKPLFSSILRR